MKKPVILRILAVLALYCAVFVAVVVAQFSQKGTFTLRLGTMAISGQNRAAEERGAAPNERYLAGGALVFFGGLEFNLRNRDDTLFDHNGFLLVDAAGRRQPAIPEYLNLSGDAARFRLPGGTEIVFSALYSAGGPELRISAVFDGGVSGLEIPFKPRRASVTRGAGDGQLTVLYENAYYQFSGASGETEKGWLTLNGANPSVSYRARPRQNSFNPGDFALAQARTVQAFDEAFDRWRDQSFSYWGRMSQNDEDTVIAYCGESIRRGSYRAVTASVSSGSISGSQRSYESSVYLGGMGEAVRSFNAAEREKFSHISRLINEKSPALLLESHVFEFLSVRGFTEYVDAGLDFIRSIDPAALTVDLTPGVFEGYMDLKRWRFQADNPFERLIEQSCRLVSGGIQKDSGQTLVFVFRDGSAESEFNLRLGKAIWLWADNAGNDGWAALGRSLALSVLSLADNEGSAPAALVRSESGETGEAPDNRISAARIYRILNPGEYYPRTAGIGSVTSGIWAWTAAPVMSSVRDANTLDILVTFPENESHYMIIRGIEPFEKIQLYNRDWPTDSQFERYDSAGWVYYSQYNILVLKIKHRGTEEHIKIIFRSEN